MRVFPSALLASAISFFLVIPAPSGAEDAPPEPQPRPQRVLTAAEAAHEKLQAAFDAADQHHWDDAQKLAGGHALAAKLIGWRLLVDGPMPVDFVAASAFLTANPGWPANRKIQARAEAAMPDNMAAADVVAWFAGHAPVSSHGWMRLGLAERTLGQRSKAMADLCQGWTYGRFPRADEKLYAGQVKLPAKCQRARLDYMLWRGDMLRAGWQLARVDAKSRALAEARIAVQRGLRSAWQHIQALPAEQQADPALTFDRARAFRRREKYDDAEAMLRKLPGTDVAVDHPRELWTELAITARHALGEGKPEAAYALISHAGFVSEGAGVVPYADAEFLAGWIALRKLHRPKAALAHFRKLSANVGRPISLARGAYWQGRALQAMGRKAEAWQAYRKAAAHPETYYGQLAIVRSMAHPQLHLTRSQVTPPAEAAFAADDLISALKLLADLGQPQAFKTFALQYHRNHSDGGHTLALIRLCEGLGYPNVAVRIAKLASYDGYMFPSHAYPVIEVPPYPGEGAGPEKALVLALIRQETEFDVHATSPVGAQGLMQIMPRSARRYADKAGLRYDRYLLQHDPAYNMRLGQTMVAEYWSKWNFVLPLGAASYNAGPAATERWIRLNGDPRMDDTDTIDWIEEIPYSETRNYVQRVLENVQVYRYRLAGHAVPLKIFQDLKAEPPEPLVQPKTVP